MRPIYKIGGPVTNGEVAAAHQAITGHPLDMRVVNMRMQYLIELFPMRFEHEVNKQRGWAIDGEFTCINK